MENDPANREETGRNPNGTFKPGFSGNPSGRPKNSLKDYLKAKLSDMLPEEKEAWLKANKISGDLQWRMAEGNPHQSGELDIELNPKPLLDALYDKEGKKEDAP